MFDGAAGAFFRDFLRYPLLVHSSIQDGPGYTARVLPLEEQAFAFAILEPEDLAVSTDEQLALGRVDLPGRK